MKKTTITLSYDEEKLNALKLYLEQKNAQVEDELTSALDTLYQKNVPSGVREFIDMRSGTAHLHLLPRCADRNPSLPLPWAKPHRR